MEGEALHPHEGSFGDPKSPCQGACRRVHGCWTHLCLSMHAWACEHGSDPFRNETCSPAVGPCPWSVTTAATEQHPCPRAGSQHMEPLVAMAPDTTAGAAGRQRQGRCPGRVPGGAGTGALVPFPCSMGGTSQAQAAPTVLGGCRGHPGGTTRVLFIFKALPVLTLILSPPRRALLSSPHLSIPKQPQPGQAPWEAARSAQCWLRHRGESRGKGSARTCRNQPPPHHACRAPRWHTRARHGTSAAISTRHQGGHPEGPCPVLTSPPQETAPHRASKAQRFNKTTCIAVVIVIYRSNIRKTSGNEEKTNNVIVINRRCVLGGDTSTHRHSHTHTEPWELKVGGSHLPPPHKASSFSQIIKMGVPRIQPPSQPAQPP